MDGRKNYLRLLGVPDYLRGEFDFAAVAPRRSARGPVPSGARPHRTPAASERSARPSRPAAPPLPATGRGRADPRPRPAAPAKIAVPLSAPERYRPRLDLLARNNAPISREAGGDDGAFTPAERTQWTQLQQEVSACTRCSLHRSRTHPVFGDGSLAPRLVIVGEGPGADEDYSGLPFVGRSGRLLTSMIDAIGFSRPQVYICNAVKCRPPSNRNPQPEELQACADYLDRQLIMLRPQLILALGAVAARRMLNSDQPVGRLRGRQHSYETGGHSFPLFVSYHPSYLLRQASQKEAAWKDLKQVIRFFAGIGSGSGSDSVAG